jgi:DNA-binding LytR/AlgR family response regulator
LTALEARLPCVQFLRISRSTIVNVSRMREVYFKRHATASSSLEDGTKLGLARNYRRSLDRFLVGR